MIEQKYSISSTEEIIKSVRERRNDLISELLKESGLMSYLDDHYETFTLSTVKKQFLIRDLMELQKSSLDLVQYSSLIKLIKESGLTEFRDHPLFYLELDHILKKYGIDRLRK